MSEDHTMCKWTGPSTSCAAMTIYRGVTEAGMAAILDRHNDLRRRVAKGEETGGINPPQPQAANMRKLVWDAELAEIAQRLVDQCIFQHDSARNPLSDIYAGQNLFISGSSLESGEDAVQAALANAAQAWYDEVTDPGFDSNGVGSYVFNSGTGHYTQVVWANTEKVGCGVTYYKDGSWYRSLVACNYIKGGNFGGQAMYEVGAACSNCPTGYACEDGLCVAP